MIRLRPEERAYLERTGRCSRCPHLVALHPMSDAGEEACLVCECGTGTQAPDWKPPGEA